MTQAGAWGSIRARHFEQLWSYSEFLPAMQSTTMSRDMNPRIVAISGPLKGSIFSIDESDLIIGRARSCSVRLDDPSVSTRHCSINRAGEYSLLADLGSAAGTFANGFCFPGKIL